MLLCSALKIGCSSSKSSGGRGRQPLLLLLLLGSLGAVRSWYANVTLTSLGGDLSVVVFLPHGLKPEEHAFYYASRFDHGSMIGDIRRKVRTINSNGEVVEKTHVLFETDMWRVPHNSNWPESGVGLASEFGVGDDGAFCYYRCGWSSASDVTNGVLGYREARNGEPFLKIGVGELVKGTCPTCDSTDDYRFNSPYLFSRPPEWKILEISDHSITLEHEAHLSIFGYKLVKSISLDGEALSVTTSLTNLSIQPFSTAWYSHNFFSCDGNAVGPGYSVDLGLKGDTTPLYEEPGTWSWSTALREYARVSRQTEKVKIEMFRALGPGVRIKTEFVNDGSTTGGYKINACGTSIQSNLYKEGGQEGMSMYAYNLYIERGTLSPEPQILIYLDPGSTATWTQRLVISDPDKSYPDSPSQLGLQSIASFPVAVSSKLSLVSFFGFGLLVLVTSTIAVFWSRRSLQRRKHQYSTIPDHEGFCDR